MSFWMRIRFTIWKAFERAISGRSSRMPGDDATLEDPRGSRSLLPRVAAVVAIGLMSWWLLAYWYRSAPIVPIWDGWFWIEQAKAFGEGGFRRLLRDEHPFVYSDHIYFLPSMLSLILGPLVGFSARPFALLCVIGLIGSGLVFYRLARWNGVDRAGAVLAFLSVASFRHWENMLLGFQVGFPLCVFLGSLALFIADSRRTRWGMILAGTLALSSAFSSSGGLALLISLILVLWVDPFRPLRCLGIGVIIAIVAVGVHFSLLAMYHTSFIGDARGKYTLEQLPQTIVHAAMLIGGSLVGGKASEPVGVALLAGTCALIAVQIRNTKRIDALSGLAIWSVLNVMIIAGARLPFESPASRHEIFAAPALGACVIGLGRLLSSFRRMRLPFYVAMFACLAWSMAVNYLDAVEYEQIIAESDLETRFYVLAQADGQVLTQEELKKVYPFEIRSIIQYTIDHHWTIFDGHDNSFEFHHELPEKCFGAAHANMSGGEIEFTGGGYVYNEYACPYSTGCAIQLSADIETMGTSTLGIMLLDSDGVEYANLNVLVPPSATFALASLRALAKPGTTIRPYAYAATPQDHVRIKRFSVGILQYAPKL